MPDLAFREMVGARLCTPAPPLSPVFNQPVLWRSRWLEAEVGARVSRPEAYDSCRWIVEVSYAASSGFVHPELADLAPSGPRHAHGHE